MPAWNRCVISCVDAWNRLVMWYCAWNIFLWYLFNQLYFIDASESQCNAFSTPQLKTCGLSMKCRTLEAACPFQYRQETCTTDHFQVHPNCTSTRALIIALRQWSSLPLAQYFLQHWKKLGQKLRKTVSLFSNHTGYTIHKKRCKLLVHDFFEKRDVGFSR